MLAFDSKFPRPVNNHNCVHLSMKLAMERGQLFCQRRSKHSWITAFAQTWRNPDRLGIASLQKTSEVYSHKLKTKWRGLWNNETFYYFWFHITRLAYTIHSVWLHIGQNNPKILLKMNQDLEFDINATCSWSTFFVVCFICPEVTILAVGVLNPPSNI